MKVRVSLRLELRGERKSETNVLAFATRAQCSRVGNSWPFHLSRERSEMSSRTIRNKNIATYPGWRGERTGTREGFAGSPIGTDKANGLCVSSILLARARNARFQEKSQSLANDSQLQREIVILAFLPRPPLLLLLLLLLLPSALQNAKRSLVPAQRTTRAR